MLPKPEACRGCPLYGNGMGFVPDELIEGAPVMVVGQNPGEQEEAAGRPFVGDTGKAMMKGFFPLAKLERGVNVSIGNSLRCRWRGSNNLPPIDSPESRAALEHCTRAHLRIPEGTRLIVAQGAYATYQLTGHGIEKNDKISDLRGWVFHYKEPRGDSGHSSLHLDCAVYTPGPDDLPVLATVHLAALMRDPLLKLPTQKDWLKVRRILAGRWPERLPPIETKPPEKWPELAAFDTEFIDGDLVRYSLATPDRRVWVVESADVGGTLVVPEEATVIMHNAPADIRFLGRILGRLPKIEDTMLGHATLWSDLPHDLGFGGSLHSRLNRWKHLGPFTPNPVEYSAGDALGTLDFWDGLMREFQEDERSWWIYENTMRDLVYVMMNASEHGLATDQGKIHQAMRVMEATAQEETLKAQAACGFPLNLASPDMVARWLFDVEGVKAKKGRAA